MSDLRAALDGIVSGLAARPERAIKRFRSVSTMTRGLACETEVGGRRIVTDFPLSRDAVTAGPTPNDLVAAAVGSCLATALVLEAARAELPLDAVQVTVEADLDRRGLFGVAPVASGFAGLRYTVVARSSAGEAQMRELLARVDARSPVLDNLRRVVPIAGTLEVTAG